MPASHIGGAIAPRDHIPLYEVEHNLLRALTGGTPNVPGDGIDRDRAAVGRAMDWLATAFDVPYAVSPATCPDRKARDEIGAILRAAGLQADANGIYKLVVWQPIATATLEGPVDLWAKSWVAERDAFVFERFPNCRWDSGDRTCNRRACWSGLPDGWHATHWMPAPDGPECPTYARTTPE